MGKGLEWRPREILSKVEVFGFYQERCEKGLKVIKE